MDDRRTGWIAWPLLVLSALPVAVTAVVARRVLTGTSSLYGQLPNGLPLRERAALLLTYATHDVFLLVPLVALASLLWLARRESRRPPPPASLWCGALLAAVVGALALGQCALVGYFAASESPGDGDVGFVGPDASLLELFGGRAATSLLLAALATGLAVVLVSAARRSGGPGGALLDEQPPEPDPLPATPPEPEPSAAPERDPHERYRRPS